MVERFNRTLKERLWVHMTDENYYRYIDILPDVISEYNTSRHSSIGMAPADVGSEHVTMLLEKLYSTAEQPKVPPGFQVGDKVRVATSKLKFEKGYEANYSEMIFKIIEARTSHEHYLYRIADLADKEEPGWFYEKELSRVIINDRERHRISRVVRERTLNGRKQYLVNWVGYPSAFDSWEFADELT